MDIKIKGDCIMGNLVRECPVEKIKYPRSKRKLPVVLNLSEVEIIFSVTKNLKYKAILNYS